jgi:hypothetical protein
MPADELPWLALHPTGDWAILDPTVFQLSDHRARDLVPRYQRLDDLVMLRHARYPLPETGRDRRARSDARGSPSLKDQRFGT